ncbi:MAG: Na+/H+ antiporter subunit E [Candidatus Bipolaricaulis sp.]|nr:Na+/H+ antiporter subunit E [Candidatus Bipolaricaulis sp.]
MIAAGLLFVVWLSLTRSAEPLSLVAAGVVTALALLVRRWILPVGWAGGSEAWRRPHRVVVYLVTLVWRLLQSTAYTSWVILFRREEGRILALPTSLRHPVAQFVLSTSITLTPSTISLLYEDELLYIHWLGVKGSSGDWRSIKDVLERQVLQLWEGCGRDRS